MLVYQEYYINKWREYNLAWSLLILGALFKVLLWPAYHSTDFDVHRNWLAITSQLPVNKWYYEATSEWTLDYPPLFAYFEYLLSRFVPERVVKDGCLELIEHGRYGWPTVVFQRSTVMISELFFGYTLFRLACCEKLGLNWRQRHAAAAALWLSPAWLVLDHLHFQYNAMLFGFVILTFVYAAEHQYNKLAAAFSTALCFKHIYLYLAPAYGIFLARAVIFPQGLLKPQLYAGAKLAIATLVPFAVAFLPFANQLPQVLSRLFPFSRGLTHAYWAANAWALYSFTDRVLGLVFKNSVTAATRGLVGQVEFANLPDITPKAAALTTLVFQLLGSVPVLRVPTFDNFVTAVAMCGFASFTFGWHVHEKAVLLVIVPITILAFKQRRLVPSYMVLITAGYVGLLPLLYESSEFVIKYTYTGIYILVLNTILPDLAPPAAQSQSYSLEFFANAYLLCTVPVMLAAECAGLIVPRLQFLKLMIISTWCAIGVCSVFVALNFELFRH